MQADDGLCTLHEAVDAVNKNTASGTTSGECGAGDANPAFDEIIFDLDLFPAYIPIFAPIELNEPVKIVGPSPDLMSIASFTLNRVFVIENIQPDAYFQISGMTLQDNPLPQATPHLWAAILSSLSVGSELLLVNLKFFNNSSQVGGGGLYSSPINPPRLFNTIIALNTDSSNDMAADLTGSVVSFGFNFIGANSSVGGIFPAGQPNANGDWAGTADAVLNPNLEPLADNGGSTLTHLPRLTSRTNPSHWRCGRRSKCCCRWCIYLYHQ